MAKKEKLKMYRQGDVLVIQTTAAIPSDAVAIEPEGGRVILAHGEVTGHAHAIAAKIATLYMLEGARRMLEMRQAGPLEHEEHAPIDLPEGCYIVKRQREFEPETIRYVAD